MGNQKDERKTPLFLSIMTSVSVLSVILFVIAFIYSYLKRGEFAVGGEFMVLLLPFVILALYDNTQDFIQTAKDTWSEHKRRGGE